MTVIDDWSNEMDNGDLDGIRDILFERISAQIDVTRGELLAYWDTIVRFAIMNRSGHNDGERPPFDEVANCLRSQMDRIDNHVHWILEYRKHD